MDLEWRTDHYGNKITGIEIDETQYKMIIVKETGKRILEFNTCAWGTCLAEQEINELRIFLNKCMEKD